MTFLRLIYTDANGQHAVALDRHMTTIGRLPNQDVVLHDQRVSREHAMIVREDNSYSIVDRNSSHGSFLNGIRIHSAALNSGDLLQLGSVDGPRLLFQLDTARERHSALHHSTVTNLLSSITESPNPDEKRLPAVREMERLNWLLNAARQLNAGGAIEDILTTLLHLTLQFTGLDRGFVFLSKGGEMELARGLNSQGQFVDQDLTVSRQAIQKAIESDAKFSISDTLMDGDASAWASVREHKIRSIYCIPLRKRDAKRQQSDLLGLLYLDSQIGAGSLSEVDHQLLGAIATEASALVQNALLAEAEYKLRSAREELAVAARIHSGLMSIAMPTIPFAELQARSIPCYDIGGDFFDAVVLDDCVCVAIADVSGKGLPAAIVAATMQGIIHAQLRSGQGLPEIALLLNRFLCERNVGKYATMVLLKLFPNGRVEFMNCGHIQPLLIHDTGVRWLEESNPIVGLLADATYSCACLTLQVGDRILLATDGLVEAENSAGDSFGELRFTEIAQHLDLDGILDHVARFQAPNEAQDDCTLVEVCYGRGSSLSPRKTVQ